MAALVEDEDLMIYRTSGVPTRLGIAVFSCVLVVVGAHAQEELAAPTWEELLECKETLETAWSQVEALEAEVSDLTSALEASEAEVARRAAAPSGDELAASVKREKELRSALDKRNAVLARLKSALVSQRERVNELEASLAQSPTTGTDATAALEERLSKLELELASYREQLASRDREVAVARKEASEAKAALAKLKGEPPAPAQKPVEVASRPRPAPGKKPADEKDPYKAIVAGHRALKEGNLADAERFFLQAQALNPSLVESKLGLAALYYARGDFAPAKELLAQVLSEDPSNAQGLGLAGILAWQEGDLRLATRRLEKAIRNEPENAQFHNHYGVVLHARNKTDSALKALRKAVELDPRHSESRFNLAVLLATGRNPDKDEARAQYQAALELGTPKDDDLERLLYP